MEDGDECFESSFRLQYCTVIARMVVYCTAAGMYVCTTLSSACTGTIPGSEQ